MGLFKQQKQAANLTFRQQLENKYNVARTSLLLVVILTAVNLVLLLIQDYSYFLFSASIPYLLAELGMFLCGKYPAEYYGEELPNMTFLDDTVLVVLSILAFLIVAVYLVLWFFSRRRAACLTAALVLFSIDTLLLLILLTPSISGLLDVLFHGLIIYELVVGRRAHRTLVHLPPEGITDVPFTDAAAGEPTLFETVMNDGAADTPEAPDAPSTDAAETDETANTTVATDTSETADTSDTTETAGATVTADTSDTAEANEATEADHNS